MYGRLYEPAFANQILCKNCHSTSVTRMDTGCVRDGKIRWKCKKYFMLIARWENIKSKCRTCEINKSIIIFQTVFLLENTIKIFKSVGMA